MKKMILATSLLIAGLAQATEIKVWPEQARCSARFTYLLVNEPDLRKSMKNEEKDILLNLKKGEYGSASAETKFEFPAANTQINLRVSLSNYDHENKPSDEKSLIVSASLIVDGKISGVVSVLQKGKSTDRHLINGFNLTNPEREMVDQYRFANQDRKLSVRDAMKELFPGKEVFSGEVYLSCTATPYEQTPVDPKF